MGGVTAPPPPCMLKLGGGLGGEGAKLEAKILLFLSTENTIYKIHKSNFEIRTAELPEILYKIDDPTIYFF